MTTDEYRKYDRIVAQIIEYLGKRKIGGSNVYLKDIDINSESQLCLINLIKIFSDVIGTDVYVNMPFFQFRKLRKLTAPFEHLNRTKDKQASYVSLSQLVRDVEKELSVSSLTLGFIYCLYYKRSK